MCYQEPCVKCWRCGMCAAECYEKYPIAFTCPKKEAGMNEGQNGRIKINDGDWIDANIEMDFSPSEAIIQEPKFSHGWAHLKQWSTGAKIEGTLTSYGVELFRGMFQEWARPEPWMFLVSQETMWRAQYAKQGKHYPRPKKRKSKMRMSKQWRDR